MHLAQGLPHRAQLALIASRMFGEALRQNDGPVDGADRFERGNISRLARQTVPAVRALVRR